MSITASRLPLRDRDYNDHQKVISRSGGGKNPIYENLVRTPLLTKVTSWNARGLWVGDRKLRAIKLRKLARLVTLSDVVAIQESHLHKNKAGALIRWCFRHGVIPYRTQVRGSRLGGLLLVKQTLFKD